MPHAVEGERPGLGTGDVRHRRPGDRRVQVGRLDRHMTADRRVVAEAVLAREFRLGPEQV